MIKQTTLSFSKISKKCQLVSGLMQPQRKLFHNSIVNNAPIRQQIDPEPFYKFSRDFGISSAKANRQISLVFRVPNKNNDEKKENGMKGYCNMMLSLYIFDWMRNQGKGLPSLAKAVELLEQAQEAESGSEENIKYREEMAQEFGRIFSSSEPEIEAIKKLSVSERQNVVKLESFLLAYPFLKGYFTRDFQKEAQESGGKVNTTDFTISVNPNNIQETFDTTTAKIKRISEYFMPELFERVKNVGVEMSSLLVESNRDAVYEFNYKLLAILFNKQILAQIAARRKKDLATMTPEDIEKMLANLSSAEFAMAIGGNPYDQIVMAAISNLGIHAV